MIRFAPRVRVLALCAAVACPSFPWARAGGADALHGPGIEDELRVLGARVEDGVFLLRLSGTRAFDRGSPAMTEHAASKLRRLAVFLRRHPGVRVKVEGHMDAAEWDFYPRDVSSVRAMGVREFLVRAGIARDLIEVRGYGRSRPERRSQRRSALNRRVDIILSVPTEPYGEEVPPPGSVGARPTEPYREEVCPSDDARKCDRALRRGNAASEGRWEAARPRDPLGSGPPPGSVGARPTEPYREASPPSRPGPSWVETFRWNGHVASEAAYASARPQGWTKLRNAAWLSGSGKLSENVSCKATGRAYYDAVYALSRRYPPQAAEDMRTMAELREAYVDVSPGDWELRLGKQQVVWGESVGVFLADAVNARDLRELILQDFETIRRPQWAADVERSWGDAHLELVWTPFPLFHRQGVPGSEFEQPVALPPGVRVRRGEVRRPARTLENSEFGGKVSYLAGGWDVAAFHLYAWDRFPALLRTVSIGPAIDVSPSHPRLPLTGATFSKEAGGAVWKGEALYSHGQRLSTLDLADEDGLARRDALDVLLGVDHTFWGRVDTNVQVIERTVFEHGPAPLSGEKPRRWWGSFWIKTGFFDNRLEPELLLVSDLEGGDLLARPQLSRKLGDHWRLRLGADILEGRPDGSFGFFDAKDRLWAELRRSF